MPKIKKIYTCTTCNQHHPQWVGQCGHCGSWNSIEEQTTRTPHPSNRSGYAGVDQPARLTCLTDVGLQEHQRITTGLEELDRVLGGGLVPGSVILVGGDPGVGKSTLLLQTLGCMQAQERVFYITGEESLQQIAARAQRLNLSHTKIMLCAETHIESIMALVVKHQPQVLVVDSIQTIYSDQIQAAAGSVTQVRESTAMLVHLAKKHHIVVLLAGHVTKEGMIAGPRVLEHMVDTVLYFEGQSDQRFRMIRSVKNRFGTVNALGLFEMTQQGLQEIKSPSKLFLSERSTHQTGHIILASWEGSRPLLVEVQALVSRSCLEQPRRVVVGLESYRLVMLLAVLARHTQVKLYDKDIFINVVGGLRVTETASDLSVLLTILSELKRCPLPQDCVVFGEVGLSGELRSVPGGHERWQEALRHGFKQAIVPQTYLMKDKNPFPQARGTTIHPIQHVSQLLALPIFQTSS